MIPYDALSLWAQDQDCLLNPVPRKDQAES